jgi:hypothetical protein
MDDCQDESPMTPEPTLWPYTQCSLLQGNTAVSFLFMNHLTLHEDLIFKAMEQFDGDTAPASTWCSTIEKADGVWRKGFLLGLLSEQGLVLVRE